MPASRIALPVPPVRGARIRRGLIAATAGALLLLGAACTGGTSEADPPAEAPDSVANVDTTTPERPQLVAGAVSSAAAVDSAPALPEWVTARLEAPPPQLALTYPAEGSTVTESYVMFSGKAEPGSTVASGPFETKADAHGQWNIGLVLSAGQNVATFSTTSTEGVETKESVTVHFKPKDSHNKHKSGDGSFNASQHYGSCGDKLPYDVFKGKADPGTTVTVSSAYGGGTTTAGDGGYWKLKVTFEAAPVGVEFPVTVSDGSTTKTFSFTRTA